MVTINTKVIVRNNNNEKLDISDLVSKVTIQGDYTQGARRLDCSYMASSLDSNIPIAQIQEFNYMYFYQDNKLVFRGTIYEISKDSSNNLITFYAYDEGVRTLKAKATYNFVDKTVTEIVNIIVKEFNIPIESFIKSDIKITKIFFGQTLYDIFMSIYTIVSQSTGKKYMLEWTTDGKMRIVEKGIITLDVSFEEGYNLMSSSYTINLDNIVNRVAICDESYNYIKEVRDEETIKLYGIFQDIVKQTNGSDATEEAKAKLKGVEKKCTLSGFGDYTCITGRGVKVKDTYTGLVGLFYIDADTHTWENGVYSIDLELNFKNIMNEMDKSEAEITNTDEVKQEGTTVVGGKEVDAEFTAYYPCNDSMQGGYYDAQGNKLDPKKLTCAAPKELAFGTKIQVKGTGTSRDNLVYKVTDRGGAIKIVNGVYKFDLLMATKEECLAFGRRKGKALIGVDVINATVSESANTIGAKLVAEAKKHLGKKYVWGATGPNTFDCSGLTQYCHKKLGISIPRTSLAQSNSGKSVSKSNLQMGDLIFWKTTSAKVGHVGMYVGNGQFIHAPNSRSVVKIDSLSNSYYSSRYVNARRYW
uniref:43 kDa tail protein n=1 Tax=Siphoviridae sp. ctcx61 TaxID=2825575 RepID=A0A8S5TWI4_9CAUD|nr:MAG TPA: 43 kDa tail protein [Siphoviridae sp. ctcx61]